MKFHILASGSQGNSLLIESQKAKVLIDCGITFKKIKEKLLKLNVSLEELDAVLITHGHTDHVRCLTNISKIVPVFMSSKLFKELQYKKKLDSNSKVRFFSHKEPFCIGDILISAIPVVHDCIDPVGFVLESRGEKFAVLTDIGIITEDIKEALKKCTKIFIEANHDINLLSQSKRPWFLKDRILKNNGHLSNRNAGRLISSVYEPFLKEVILMHLSEECNMPDLAIKTVLEELENNGISCLNIKAASRDGLHVL